MIIPERMVSIISYNHQPSTKRGLEQRSYGPRSKDGNVGNPIINLPFGGWFVEPICDFGDDLLSLVGGLNPL